MATFDVALHRLIDQASDRFESAWMAGERPSLETFLDGQDPPFRSELLRELLAIELQYLSRSGTPWDVAEYHRRFPNDTAIIDEVLTSSAQAESHSTGGAVTHQSQKAQAESDVDDDLDWLVGQKLGRYEIRRRLGQGGMGIVFQAWHPVMDRLVALKVLPPDSAQNRQFIQRFRREVQTVAKLSHPNIVAAQDADEADGHHFLVMEFVEGRDLSAMVKQDGPFSVEKAVDFVRQAALGLEYAHKKGVIHRDIKPSNLMVTPDGVVKVLDLGLVRLGNDPSEPVAKAELTGSGQVLGTPDYMAPEQWDDTHSVDGRADLYSLGCTLFYLLSGRAPYSDERHRPITRKMAGHVFEPIPDLPAARTAAATSVNSSDETIGATLSGKSLSEIPPELTAIYQRLMAKQPGDRFGSAGELVQALNVVLARLTEAPQPASEPIIRRTEHETRPEDETTNLVIKRGDFPNSQSFQMKLATDKPPSAVEEPSRTARWPVVIGLALLGLVLLAGVIFKLKTARGTIIVEVNEPDAQVEVFSDEGKIEITRQSDSKPITISLDPGKHRLKVQKDGFELFAEEFSLETAGKKTISAKLVVVPVSHGWPADAPPPAIAPFNAVVAKKHQAVWAKHLGVPVEYTNSIGMKFILIPPGEFLMGTTPAEIEEFLKAAGEDKVQQDLIKREAPQHKVILTQPIYLGIHEVTQAQYEQVIGQNPSHFAPTGEMKDRVAGMNTTNHPVEMVNWNDAAEFCAKLSQQEKLKPFYFRDGETVTPLNGTGYRLPTEAEWEFSCRAGTTTKYWIGDQDEDLAQAAWFGANSGGRTHAVGELKGNPFGLYDIHGNVYEWVQDWFDPNYYAQFQGQPAIDPSGPSSAGSLRVDRGSYWLNPAFTCRAAYRDAQDPTFRHRDWGFRVSLMVDAVKAAIAEGTTKPDIATSVWHGWPADAPPPAIAPFNADAAKKHQAAWATFLKLPVEYTNSLGMKFILIPPGEFTMGSTLAEIEEALKNSGNDSQWQDRIKSEAPQHKVILTQPIYIGVHEVTQGQHEQVMGTNPSYFAPMGKGRVAVDGMDTTRHPVETVSWNDAAEFCAKLSQQEKLKPFYLRAGEVVTPLDGTGYRLPTEAEWEFACRAGTTTKYWIGDKDEDLAQAGWFGTNSGGRTHAVGELKVNPFGLFDIHGNAYEWVQDLWETTYYWRSQEKPAINPIGPSSAGAPRVIRGGNWYDPVSGCRASNRHANGATILARHNGFRLALVVDAVRQELKESPAFLPIENVHDVIGDKLPPGQWYDVLKLVDVERHAIDSQWKRTSDGVARVSGRLAQMVVPVQVQGDYELSFAFTRLSGDNDVVLHLPVGDGTCCRLILSGWSGAVSGLSVVDGRMPNDQPASPAVVRPGSLKNLHKYEGRARVRLNGAAAVIEVELEGKPYLHWQGSRASLKPYDWQSLTRTDLLGFGTYYLPVVFHELRFKPLTKSERVWNPDRPDFANAPPPDLKADSVQWNGHSYWMSDKTMHFRDAVALAQRHHARLLQVSSRAENEFVLAQWPYRSVWLGAWRSGKEVNPRVGWLDQQLRPLRFFDWSPTAPQNFDGETFLAINRGDCLWNDYEADSGNHVCLEWGDETSPVADEATPVVISPLNTPPEFRLATNGLGGKTHVDPVIWEKSWFEKDSFAHVRGPGFMVFPKVQGFSYAVDIEITRKAGGGGMSFFTGDSFDFNNWLPAVDGTWLPIEVGLVGHNVVSYSIWNRYQGGLSTRSDRLQAEIEKPLRMSLLVNETRTAIVQNSECVSRGFCSPADPLLQFKSDSGEHAIIHRCQMRPLTKEDCDAAGWPMPPKDLTFDVKATEARLAKLNAGLLDKPEAGKPFRAPTTGMSLNWIEPGTFGMGVGNENKPIFQAKITRGFWMGRYEVTQQEWSELMPKRNPSRLTGSPYLPVECVTHEEALTFCAELTGKERAAGNIPDGQEYRLPTEAEWEYCARAGRAGAFDVPRCRSVDDQDLRLATA